MEQGSTSSPPPPEPFCGPSSHLDEPDAEDTENIKQTSSPPPPEPFPEPSPSPEPQESELQPLQVQELQGHQQKLMNWTDPSHFCHQLHCRLQILF